MAATPLFETDLDTLKSKLRLSQLSETSDGYALFEEALRSVRVGFIRELTKSRVDTIKATSLVDDPDTDAEVLRVVAATTEVMWVRYTLMATMPTLFMDQGGQDALQVWNEEGAFRSPSALGFEQRRNALLNEINANLDLLKGDTSVGDEAINFFVIEPEETPDPPGNSAGIV